MKSFEKKHHVHIIIMKVTLTNLLLLALFLTSYAKPAFGQELLKRTVTINVANVSVKRILNLIEEQAQVKISYSSKALNAQKKVDISSNNESIESVLQKLFGDEVKAALLEKHILLLKADKAMPIRNLTAKYPPPPPPPTPPRRHANTTTPPPPPPPYKGLCAMKTASLSPASMSLRRERQTEL